MIRPFVLPTDTILQKNAGEKKYCKSLRIPENIHLGQLKLFSNELQFILDYVYTQDNTNRKMIVYIGAGPGEHIATLAKLFPDIEWHLYDSRFTEELTKISNVNLNTRYFEEEDIKKYTELREDPSLDLYLFSDIRTLDYSKGEWSINEEEMVMKDMDLQSSWVKAIRPKFSMLKMRLPYCEDDVIEKCGGEYIDYLDGTIYFQPWARNKSTETRLVVDGNNIREVKYSFRKYENQLCHHNAVTRLSHFSYPLFIKLKGVKVSEALTLDDKYDSAFTIALLYTYFKRSYKDLPDDTIVKRIVKILSIVSMGKKFYN